MYAFFQQFTNSTTIMVEFTAVISYVKITITEIV